MNRNTGLGALLIAVGVLIVLNFIGLGHFFRGIFSFLIPIVFIGAGVLGWRTGRRNIGVLLAVIGVLMLLAKFSGLITLLLAVGLIGWGVSKIRRNGNGRRFF